MRAGDCAGHDVGFTNDEVENYMRLLLEGDNTEQERLEIIRRHRDSTLDEIHFKQAQLDRLDYLRYKIQKAGQQKTNKSQEVSS